MNRHSSMANLGLISKDHLPINSKDHHPFPSKAQPPKIQSKSPVCIIPKKTQAYKALNKTNKAQVTLNTPPPNTKEFYEQKQRNFKQMKNKLVELEERLGKLKSNYYKNSMKKQSKSQKTLKVSGFHKKGQIGKEIDHIDKENTPSKKNTQYYLQKQIKNPNNLEDQKLETPELKKLLKERITTNKPQNQVNNQQQILKDYITQESVSQTVTLPRNSTSETNILLHTKEKLNKFSSLYYYSQVNKALKSKSPNIFQQICKAHFNTNFEFLKNFKISAVNKAKITKVPQKKLPSPKKPQTIVLDMDETIMHCISKTQESQNHAFSEVKLPIVFPDKRKLTVGINIRPYVHECLKALSKNFELVVFTASHSSYANVVIDYIDPKNEYISHRFYRQSCIKSEDGYYVKDLRVIDRKLENMLLVDNAAYSYCLQPENGVPIIPFYDNKADFQLKNLVQYIERFIGEPNMPSKNDELLKMSKYKNYQKPQDLLVSIIS